MLETRTHGEPVIWELIKSVLKMADSTHNLISGSDAVKILRNHNVLMINNSIQLSVDHKFNRY